MTYRPIQWLVLLNMAVVVNVLLASACKPPRQSDVKTLEGLATDGTSNETCMGTDVQVAGIQNILPDSALALGNVEKTQAIRTLAMIPRSILAFFVMSGGVISFDERDGQDICMAANSQVNGDDTHFVPATKLPNSCWSPKKYGQMSHRLVLWINAEKLSHGAAQAFGHIFVEVFAKESVGSDSTAKGPQFQPVSVESPQVIAFLAELEASFVNDVSENVNKYSLPTYQSLRQGNQAVAQYHVFAEAFDSFYCSQQSREAMQSDFPKSFALMSKFDKFFGDWPVVPREVPPIGIAIIQAVSVLGRQNGQVDWKSAAIKKNQPEGASLWSQWSDGSAEDDWEFIDDYDLNDDDDFRSTSCRSFRSTQSSTTAWNRCNNGYRSSSSRFGDLDDSWEWNSNSSLSLDRFGSYRGYDGFGGQAGYGDCSGRVGTLNRFSFDSFDPYGLGMNGGIGGGTFGRNTSSCGLRASPGGAIAGAGMQLATGFISMNRANRQVQESLNAFTGNSAQAGANPQGSIPIGVKSPNTPTTNVTTGPLQGSSPVNSAAAPTGGGTFQPPAGNTAQENSKKKTTPPPPATKQSGCGTVGEGGNSKPLALGSLLLIMTIPALILR